ncbi:M23 family metallopeptidase [Cytobacillus gottheilii]|uniref:M23 family metallopeptidase n=1 Tax=Cytobacillus gottheilii TaxID=859144 RepID=A0ABX8FF69_9BACI|nr:M23 family metallopeptidase [Cytobacillus gottheilii]QVY62670.1 M23 family metallopeptidase [Cytobacillus gottheilii]
MRTDQPVTPENFGEMFLYGNPEVIYEQCSNEFKELVSFQQFSELLKSFNSNVESFHLESASHLGFVTQYVWIDERKEKAISVAFDSSDIIQSLLIKPYNTFPETDNTYSKNKYVMPINEEWFVFWGGTNEFINYHYLYESQRYAYDLVMMKEHVTYQDDPARNENYYAFGKEVTAPADGKVVKVVNHIIDNIPGEMNEKEAAGNYVVIKHEHEEYSMLAHFKESSILVEEGEALEQGQVIGLCGNSGNSSEAHIHFQVMDTPDLFNSKSLRIQFAGGEEPIQGDFVTE